MSDPSRSRQMGQVAVLFALAAVAIVAIVGLAVDGGQSYVAQRALQAGSDTAAQSGAYMLEADYLACTSGQTLHYYDSSIYSAVVSVASNANSASETANGTNPVLPQYVQYTGTVVSYLPIPDQPTTADLCASGHWTGISGVRVSTTNSHRTNLLGLIGIPLASERASATAIFGPPTGGASPFAAWFLLCQTTTSGNPLTPGDPVVLYSSQWKKSSCPEISPSSFKGYIFPQSPISLPLTVGDCIQTGVGVGLKSGISAADLPALNQTYLVPTISAANKGDCPVGTPGPSGTYALTYAGMIAVTITQEKTSASGVTSFIGGKVTSVAVPENGITICPVADLDCNQGLSAGGPLGVELYS